MTRVIASCALAGALLWGCNEKTAAPRAPDLARPMGAPAPATKAAAPQGAAVPRSIPTAAEAELALTLGKALLEEAKPEEAEVQLKVAAAGGRSEADELLLKVQSELKAKRLLAEARQKFEARDWRGAEVALGGIAEDSSLRARANELAERIGSAREEESERMKRRMERELDKEGEAAAQKPDEPKAPSSAP